MKIRKNDTTWSWRKHRSKIIAGAACLVVGAFALRLIPMLFEEQKAQGASTTVSVSVTCPPPCTEMDGVLLEVPSGTPILPGAGGEYTIYDPSVVIDLTVKGTEQLVVRLTNSLHPGPGVELFNQIFTSSDPAYSTAGQLIPILPLGGLASYLQLGRNVFDIFITSSISSPAQDIHRQIVINYLLPLQPGPVIHDAKVVNKNGSVLPYATNTTDFVATANDIPLIVSLKAENLSRVVLSVTNPNGFTGIVYDGAPLAPGASGYADYRIGVSPPEVAGLKVGKNVITLTVTGLNGAQMTRTWVVYYWPDGVEVPDTGVIRIGGMTIGVGDLAVSLGVAIVVVGIIFFVILKMRDNDKKKRRKVQKRRKTVARARK